MNGQPLTPLERVAAAMLYFFQAGADAQAALHETKGRVIIPKPTDEDLERIAEDSPRSKWNGAMSIASELVAEAVSSTERGVLDVVHDVVRTVRKGQDAINRVTGGGARDIRDLQAQQKANEKARGAR